LGKCGEPGYQPQKAHGYPLDGCFPTD